MAANTTNVVNGSDLILMIDTGTNQWQQVAHATSHSIEITRDARETSSKSTGEWMTKDYGKISWSGSVDGLVSYDATVMNYNTLVGFQIARTKIKIISVQNDYTNDTPLTDTNTAYDPSSTVIANNPFVTGTKYYEGTAIITSISKTAGDNENATFSLSFEGASALTEKTVATVI